MSEQLGRQSNFGKEEEWKAHSFVPVESQSSLASALADLVLQNKPAQFIQPLLQQGADPNELDASGYNALHQAIMHGNMAFIHLIIESKKIDRTIKAKGILSLEEIVKQSNKLSEEDKSSIVAQLAQLGDYFSPFTQNSRALFETLKVLVDANLEEEFIQLVSKERDFIEKAQFDSKSLEEYISCYLFDKRPNLIGDFLRAKSIPS